MSVNSDHAIMGEKLKESCICILKRLFLGKNYRQLISEIHASEKIVTSIFDFIDFCAKDSLRLRTALSVLELMHLRVIVSQVSLLEVPLNGLRKHASTS